MNFRYGPCGLLGLLRLCPWSGVPLPVAAMVPLAPGEQLDHRVDPEEVFVHPGPPLEPVPVSFLDVGEEVPQTRRKPIPDWTRPDCGHVHVFGGLQRDRLVSDLELPQPPDFLLEHVLRERHDGRQHAGEDVFVTVRIATARCMSDQESLAVDQEQVLDSERMLRRLTTRNESGQSEGPDDQGQPGPEHGIPGRGWRGDHDRWVDGHVRAAPDGPLARGDHPGPRLGGGFEPGRGAVAPLGSPSTVRARDARGVRAHPTVLPMTTSRSETTFVDGVAMRSKTRRSEFGLPPVGVDFVNVWATRALSAKFVELNNSRSSM